MLSCPETNKQVIVWIHGGAFIFGGIGIYNPEYIMEENVVLVTIQYRLNIFGFLSTEDSVAPGNYGKSRVSVQGVESLWGDCRFIPVDWGS